jgi:hypothetical protein
MGGSFTLKNLEGLTCQGHYPMVAMTSTIEMHMHCSDGRTGRILMSLNKSDPATGYGQGQFSDGSKFRVFMGNVSDKLRPPKFLR